MNKPKLGVEFHGDGPFDLPAAQAVSAQSHGEFSCCIFSNSGVPQRGGNGPYRNDEQSGTRTRWRDFEGLGETRLALG